MTATSIIGSGQGYVATDRIQHNGTDYKVGDVLDAEEFSELELAALIEADVIVVGVGEFTASGDENDKTDTDIAPRYVVGELAPLNYNGVDYAPGTALDDVEIAEADLVQPLAGGMIVVVADDNPAAEAGRAVSAKSKKKPAASV